MIKYIPNESNVVFEEIPHRVTMAFSISNCMNHCKGCHSPWLATDIGEELTVDTILEKYDDLIRLSNCVLFLGEGNDKEALLAINKFIKEHYTIETALYSGRDKIEDEYFHLFDFVKVGSYQEELGPLNKETTNQRLYYHGEDITNEFWNRSKNIQ